MANKEIGIDKGELAWHDHQRSLKIRKPIDGAGISGGVFALVQAKDAWHKEAFVGTGVEDQIPDTGPRKTVFHAIDFCGNVVGQIDDCPYGPIGTVYNVESLGVSAVFELVRYGAECLPDNTWAWWLEMEFTDKCKSA